MTKQYYLSESLQQMLTQPLSTKAKVLLGLGTAAELALMGGGAALLKKHFTNTPPVAAPVVDAANTHIPMIAAPIGAAAAYGAYQLYKNKKKNKE